MDPKMLARLEQDISAVCPNSGVTVHEPDVPGGIPSDPPRTEQECIIHAIPDVTTDEELADGYIVYHDFDQSPEAQAAWETEELEDAAIEGKTRKDPTHQYFRALCREIHDRLFNLEKKHNNDVSNQNNVVPEIDWQTMQTMVDQRIESGNA